MIFQVLGPLRVGDRAGPGSPVRQAILTALLLRAGQPVGIGDLAEMLWESPPDSARANIRSYVSRLRHDLDSADPGLSRRMRTHSGYESGYQLEVGPDDCDATRFVEAAGDGGTQLRRGDIERAVGTLEDAVALWRGPFGSGLPPTRWFQAHVTGLNDARLLAYEDLFTAQLLAGRTGMLSYRIEATLAESPYRQRLWELLAASHCAERNALGVAAVIRRCWALYVEDLGLDLPPSLAAAQSAALSGDYDAAVRFALDRRPGTEASWPARRPGSS